MRGKDHKGLCCHGAKSDHPRLGPGRRCTVNRGWGGGRMTLKKPWPVPPEGDYPDGPSGPTRLLRRPRPGRQPKGRRPIDWRWVWARFGVASLAVWLVFAAAFWGQQNPRKPGDVFVPPTPAVPITCNANGCATYVSPGTVPFKHCTALGCR